MADEDEVKEATEQEKEDVKEPEQSPGTKSTEKTLTQTEVNKLLAEQRRKHDAELKAAKSEYTDYKAEVEKREQAANDAAAEKVEALRKDLPEAITKLLDKLTPVEQLEWLNDPENAVTTKKVIPALPGARDEHGAQRKNIQIV